MALPFLPGVALSPEAVPFLRPDADREVVPPEPVSACVLPDAAFVFVPSEPAGGRSPHIPGLPLSSGALCVQVG